jgi:hypothetical protein
MVIGRSLGAFFDCWDTSRHVIAPFDIPKDWMRFRSMDWGSASPFSVGWWAIASDDWDVNGHHIPRGCMVRYREWYGMRPGEPNVGLKLHAGEVGKGILAREKGEEISFGVLDPSAFAEDGGPSIAERIGIDTGGKIWFRRADNQRVRLYGHIGGWDQMRARLGTGDGHAMLVVFSTCTDFIRTVHFCNTTPTGTGCLYRQRGPCGRVPLCRMRPDCGERAAKAGRCVGLRGVSQDHRGRGLEAILGRTTNVSGGKVRGVCRLAVARGNRRSHANDDLIHAEQPRRRHAGAVDERPRHGLAAAASRRRRCWPRCARSPQRGAPWAGTLAAGNARPEPAG